MKTNKILAIHDFKDVKSTTFHIKQQEENNSCGTLIRLICNYCIWLNPNGSDNLFSSEIIHKSDILLKF